mmetsp:Transcript_78631/g.138640  ORF Transcript_78631/g.138640 Transcript_78631/m.138640 type:complete len:1149 (+) Transcript_78631:41-3487(+)|eukprot:CAMPEP_0197665244 /NCGR_PEP_ID=MMETSP1338-20131121/59110_1 /TAXON_ID=43686 ORGANISM="Pelagodinium beii, Strain RCC1491" /NCGR_SAMPLE_ID=MMETSP1338 /ASSEMBLY_ACC=CAM_ASM_000754 /LENGTH=1148 /DNA_ID=CAMNT_0043244017 /DNA_START=34 /DNA_END=3480 /DNA_ORIENTATION=-
MAAATATSNIAVTHRTPQQERLELRRSLSVPNAVRQNRLATKAYLRAAEKGDVKSMRSLAIEAGAELGGIRARNIFGAEPSHILDSSGHLTQYEHKAVKHEFTELPLVINAVESVKALPSRASKSLSKTMSDSDTGSRVTSKWIGSDDTNKTPLQAKMGGTTGRLAKTENNLTRMAATLGAPDHVMHAAKSQPQLLYEHARHSEKSLPALARSLKNEELAVKAVHASPLLLRVDPVKIKRILPALISICGSAAEASYIVAKNPALLDMESPAQLRTALQVVSASISNLKDALWMCSQTTAPPTITVVARQFCRQDVVGEYFRIEGGQFDERPVWCKPATAMAHLGSAAKDVYIVYCDKGVIGGSPSEPCWTFTTNYDRSMKTSEGCDPAVLGWASSDLQSPDQVAEGRWHFPAEAKKDEVPGKWPADAYVDALDGGRERPTWLYSVPSTKLRKSFNMVKESIGLVWTQAGAAASTGPRLLGSITKGDHIHSGSSTTFTDMGGFLNVNGFNYVQLPATLPDDSPPIVLHAWEPVQVLILYRAAPPEPEKEEVEVEEPPAPKAKAKAKAKVEEEEPVEETPPEPGHILTLQEAAFERLPESMPILLPKLSDDPELEPDIFCRNFPRGWFEIPVPLGAGGVPPLVFFRQQVFGMTKSGVPCQVVKPKAQDPMYMPSKAGPKVEGEVPEPAEGEEPAGEKTLTLFSPGELGYKGFLLFRGREEDNRCEESETQLRVECADKLKVAVAWLHMPPEVEPQEGEEEAAAESSQPGSRADSKAAKLAAPPVPDWVHRDGWKEMEVRLPMVVVKPSGEHVPSVHVYGKTLEPGESLSIPGSGSEFLPFFLFKQVGPPRTDPVRSLLMREAALLTVPDNIALLITSMRAHLGDDLAREVFVAGASQIEPIGTGIMSKSTGSGADGGPRAIWPKLCQQGTASDIKAWVFEHKLDTLAAQIKNNTIAARQILTAVGGHNAEVTVPEIEDRCKALVEVLSAPSSEKTGFAGPRFGIAARTDVLLRQPFLITTDSKAFRTALEVLSRYLPLDRAAAELRKKLVLLMQPEELTHLFEMIRAKYSDEFVSLRLVERTQGEWIRWPDMVGKHDHEVLKWLGRVGVEERELACTNRLRSFGAAPHGAAAIAAATGTLPEIPPLLEE